MGTLQNPRIFFLTGPKHAGKTSVGRVLAAVYQGDFIDLDELVETQTGQSPRSLYKADPGCFSRAEIGALQTVINTGNTPKASPLLIVATGGGIIDNDDALSLLKSPGAVVMYLEVSAETAWERICRSSAATGELPPFLNTAHPQETHKNLHERRGAAYKRIAHITIQAEHKTPESICREIGTWISKYR
ncbi:MAG: shikimate kinase [Treponema sp.]|jgi:shikimate kinase|nr:shikimate kinase [Treponema sp.]